ncbi:AzlD domain-containing protein [Actinokineospora sp. NBRC 105648]|uniref:AzlD domain-containing protein n=1 Tax=Actinokineospora sp. NBRC 105648 TaxID=3032206 RepID=UPI0024A36620|nr:AzlD domain-containing protein [Actinokineospora sp. NBRC 105648]GLZ41103.1 branched-chain amino acid transporter AzlD [Actinokineospora sp. NBRC 105648]
MWTAILLGSLGCYALKLAGLSVPKTWLENPKVRRMSALLPVALLAALVAIQTFGDKDSLTVDTRTVGLAVALGAILLRLPFLAVVALAAAVTAGLRLMMG